MKPTITAVIITKNEEKMIVNCLACLKWCDQLLVIDSGSDDRTIDLAEKHGAKVLKSKATSFAELRNAAMGHVKTDWMVYIDADERVTPLLSKEILVQVETTKENALALHRENMMYGKMFHYGGWNEWVIRVLRVDSFERWTGDIHESPVFDGNAVQLHTPLLHFTHRNTVDGLKKTIAWTPVEARLLAEANVAPVKLGTLFRKGVMEFIRRAYLQKGYKDGQPGLIEAVVQGINRILVYIQVWELQQVPSLPEKYEQTELEIVQLWKQEK
jgi:glycosyltransferase involved in cell wall biosynthesis